MITPIHNPSQPKIYLAQHFLTGNWKTDSMTIHWCLQPWTRIWRQLQTRVPNHWCYINITSHPANQNIAYSIYLKSHWFCVVPLINRNTESSNDCSNWKPHTHSHPETPTKSSTDKGYPSLSVNTFPTIHFPNWEPINPNYRSHTLRLRIIFLSYLPLVTH